MPSETQACTVTVKWNAVVVRSQRVILPVGAFDQVATLLGVTSGMDTFVGRSNNLALPSSL